MNLFDYRVSPIETHPEQQSISLLTEDQTLPEHKKLISVSRLPSMSLLD
jgi:hypothetical protein